MPSLLSPVLKLAVAAVALPGLATAQPTGLDALDESRTLQTLTELGLEDLLRHALERQGVSEEDADVYLANIALSRLTGDAFVPSTERQALVLDVVGGVDDLVTREVLERDVPAMAGQMMRQATVLIDRGIGEEVRLLEYFGDNADRRRYVGPVADAVRRLLTRAGELYAAEADRLEEMIVDANQPEVQRAAAARRSSQQAASLLPFADYYRLLAIDPDSPDRVQLADELIKQLSPLDVERNPQRDFVQLLLGKISSAKSTSEGRQAARDYFDGAIAAGSDPTRLFDAYFGRTVVEALDGKPDAAEAQMDRFDAWYAQQDKEGPLAGRDPLVLVASYRVAEAKARVGETAEARAEAEQDVTRILMRLVNDYDGYRPIVTDQLLARLEDDSDLASLSPLLLDAVVDQGRAEAARVAAQQTAAANDPNIDPPTIDEETVEQGIAAARELLSRLQAGGDVDPQSVANSVFLAALMEQTLGRPMESVDLFLAYGELPSAESDRRRNAYRRALGIIEEVRADVEPGSELELAADEREARLLPVLVDEFGDEQRAFDLALRLHRNGDLAGAAAYYAKVPQDDPRLPDAQRLRFLAVAQLAAETDGEDAAYERRVAEAIEQGQAAVASLDQAIASAQGSAREAYRQRGAETRVALARLQLNEENNPEAATRLLRDLEERVEGLDGANTILDDALPLRFQAQAAAGDVDGATSDLLALLDDSDAQRGFRYIQQFRDTLSAAYDRAVQRGDAEQQRQLTLVRATVTPQLVDWIDRSDDPEYRRFAYAFRKLDAETQLQAALEEQDPTSRQQRLETARRRFSELNEAANIRQFQGLIEGLSDAERQQVLYDPEVLLSLGRIEYALGQFEQAQGRFNRLLGDRTLGEPTLLQTTDGMTRRVPNDDYWEAQLLFIRSSLESGASEEEMQRLLRRLYALNGDGVGGTKWQDEFAQLRERLGVEQ
jgi:hypothetical protein